MSEQVPRAFLDTNVWVSALLNPAGAPAVLVRSLADGRSVPVISRALMDEIRDVLGRPRLRRRYRFTDDDVSRLLTVILERAVEAFPTGDLHLCRDPDDDVLLETALLGRAQFAVSRDDDLKRDLDLAARLQEQGVQALSVAQFLDVLARWPG